MREQHGQRTKLMRWVLLEEDFLNPEFVGRVLDRFPSVIAFGVCAAQRCLS